MTGRRRSFVLNNNPGGVECEPTWALVAAGAVVGMIAVAMALGVVWFVVTRDEVTVLLVLGAVAFVAIDVAGVGFIAGACFGELRRRWVRWRGRKAGGR